MGSSGSLLAALGWFVVIVAAIPLALWLVKRSPMGPRLGVHGATTAAAMRQVSQLPLGAQQKVVTLEVGAGDERRWLVLGVAPGGVSLLYSLTPQAAPPAPPPGATASPAEGFQQLLSRLKNRGGHDRES